MLVKYRFRTKSIDDYRPLVDMKEINMPWWCTGVTDRFATIVCYLPKDENIYKYWDDAHYIDKEDVEEILYTDRFSKPKWLQ